MSLSYPFPNRLPLRVRHQGPLSYGRYAVYPRRGYLPTLLRLYNFFSGNGQENYVLGAGITLALPAAIFMNWAQSTPYPLNDFVVPLAAASVVLAMGLIVLMGIAVAADWY